MKLTPKIASTRDMISLCAYAKTLLIRHLYDTDSFKTPSAFPTFSLKTHLHPGDDVQLITRRNFSLQTPQERQQCYRRLRLRPGRELKASSQLFWGEAFHQGRRANTRINVLIYKQRGTKHQKRDLAQHIFSVLLYTRCSHVGRILLRGDAVLDVINIF